MRFKKGFTLSEILIVLMIIGLIAALTIPAILKGIAESQSKSAYNKAFKTLSDLMASEKVAGILPSRGDAVNADILFDDLVQNFSHKSFVKDENASADIGSGTTALNTGTALTDKSQYKPEVPTGAGRHKNWIITEDNIAYLLTVANKECATKNKINESQKGSSTISELNSKACYIIWVDINGLASGPNTVIASGEQALASSAKLPRLIDDQYPIYIGQDGATPGNNVLTVTGRMVGYMK